MSRLKLISLVCFNAVAAALVVALLTVLLTSDRQQPLEAQMACLQEAGAFRGAGVLGGDRGFRTIEEAEAFICHEILYPRDPKGWLMEDISATRRAPTPDRLVPFTSVTLNYQLDRRGPDLRIEVSPTVIEPVRFGIIDHLELMGTTADLIRGLDENHVILQWRARGYSFYTEARLDVGFTFNDLLAVLKTIE
jgi:hypothetical protein